MITWSLWLSGTVVALLFLYLLYALLRAEDLE